MTVSAGRVEVYVKPGCHLCDDAIAVILRVCDELRVSWSTTDLSELEPDTAAQWRDFVPVVLVDGEVHDVFRVNAARLRDALESVGKASRS